MSYQIEYLSLFCAFTLSLAACSGGDDEHTEETIEAEFCEHFTGGPYRMVTSSTTAAGAPDVTFEHTSVQITLNGGAGFVTYASGEMTDHAIALSKDVPLKVAQGGADLTIESTEKPTDAPCTELAVIYTVGLGVGTATLELGPSSEAEVSLIVEEAGEAHVE